MECPICGHPEMLHDTRNILYTYKGKTTTIANVEADYCDACGEHITDANESRRVMAQILDFNKQELSRLKEQKDE
ncbi:type II toxin-antitoxin system MqsA family antitoxin [Wielerella bovis]|uniref:type II toxin-antitoxin system MqsA family antitoxin n=1 Tax=Wielerella bovis TaxID=2917790 RepID=UPI0024B75517|nr:type II toxin-antitoxin system MqsA family antitoxin [Wielerella bovis]